MPQTALDGVDTDRKNRLDRQPAVARRSGPIAVPKKRREVSGFCAFGRTGRGREAISLASLVRSGGHGYSAGSKR